MKRQPLILLVCLMVGCSTHPMADLFDWTCPGTLGPNKVTPYGGVAIPQGPITPVGPGISVGPPAPLPVAPLLVPPAVPLPGNQPPSPFPVGEAPPPFPPNPPPPAR